MHITVEADPARVIVTKFTQMLYEHSQPEYKAVFIEAVMAAIYAVMETLTPSAPELMRIACERTIAKAKADRSSA